MVVGAIQTGLSILETVDIRGFSHTTNSRITETGPKKISSEQQLFESKYLVDDRGEWPH